MCIPKDGVELISFVGKAVLCKLEFHLLNRMVGTVGISAEILVLNAFACERCTVYIKREYLRSWRIRRIRMHVTVMLYV